MPERILQIAFATIFTPQGDGNGDENSLYLLGNSAVLRHDIYPARGRKHDDELKHDRHISASPRYLPRKGTETTNTGRSPSATMVLASPRYLPRKGTETWFFGLWWFHWHSGASPRYLPRKGTETLQRTHHQHLHRLPSPRYLPRKGTETTRSSLPSISWSYLRHDIYPARGRKHKALAHFGGNIVFTTSPRYLPRKGTETMVLKVVRRFIKRVFATIFTPQGDGNLLTTSSDVLSIISSPRYLPRKGTETS